MLTRPVGERSSPRSDAPFVIFALLWASAVLFDQGKWDKWASSPASLALSASAFWLLFRPWSARTLAVLAAVSIGVAIERAPWLSNHWVVATLASLMILVGFARFSRVIHPKRLSEELGPALRLQLLAFYGWAFFHKLNADYLDPSVSCAALFYRELGGRLAILPEAEWGAQAAIYASLAAELSIPVLLVLRRTRSVGVLIGCGFHLILSASGFFNFSSYMLALLFLFLPHDSVDRMLQRARSLRTARGVIGRFKPDTIRASYLWITRALFAIALLVLFSQASLDGGNGPTRLLLLPFEDQRSIISHGVEIAWWGWAAAVTVLFTRAIQAGSSVWPSAARLLRLQSPLYVIPVLLLVLNGALPYLGLSTEHSFAMFSNLRTEGERPNHLIMKEGAAWGKYQDDLVVIEGSTDEALQRLSHEGFLLPWFEFRSHLSRRVRESTGPVIVRYGRNRERHAVDARAVADLSRPDHWWERKLLYFRPVSADRSAPCHH